MGLMERPPRQSRCEECSTMTVTTELFEVRDRKICLACGEKKIKTWNSYMEEAARPPLRQEGA